VRPVLLAALLLGSLSCRPREEEGFARASVIERVGGAVGGPKALARPGDFVLENDKVRVAIVSVRATEDGSACEGAWCSSPGPGLYGGSLIDADLQWNDPRFPPGQGRDQLAEIFTTVNMNVIAPRLPEDVQIVNDGSDGEPAVVRVQGIAEPFITLLAALWAIVDAPDWGVVTEYIAEPGKPWIRIKTTVTPNWDGVSPLATTGESVEYGSGGIPLLDWAIEDGLVVGEFYLQGGSVDVFAPGMGFDEDGEVYAAGLRGDNTITDPFEFDFVAGVGDGLSYGISPIEGSAYVPLFTSSQTAMFGGGKGGDGTKDRFPAGSAYTYERLFFVGHGDVGSIVDGWIEARALPYGTIRGVVLEEISNEPLSKADVFAFRVTDGVAEERPWNQWRTDVDPRDGVADGSFGGRLPVGEWELMVHVQGRADGERVRITVEEGEEISLVMPATRPGVLRFTVRDELGRLVPAKVSLFRVDDVQSANPILGDAYIGGQLGTYGQAFGAPEMVLFSMYGDGEAELPPGEYVAVASRGIEYELDVSESFVVDDQRSYQVDLNVVRSVDTEGWISADLHVHSQPSHDSGVSLPDRVRTMVAEGVEFFSSTDHDFVTDFAPVIEDLGVEEWVQSAVGNEITTIEIGHFLGFPIGADHLAEANGAPDWTDRRPAELVDSLRRLGEDAGFDPIVFVGHPRDGILGYFDQYGMDPYGGTVGMAGSPGSPKIAPPLLSATNPLLKTDNLTWDFDGLEMLNGKRMELIRTPTQPELDRYAAGEELSAYAMIERTLAEQQELQDGVYRLGYGHEGQIDDWFTLLNLGFRYTVLGNSDTHGWTSVEAGCPRNFVMADTDDPAFLDDQAVADAVKAHRVVASYGPFVQMWVDGQPIGSEVVPEGGTIELAVEVQAPTWIDVDRVELYENGTLVHEWAVEETKDTVRLSETLELTPTRDAWYVVMVLGDQDLAPVMTPVEMPQIELQMVVTEALAGVEAVGSLLSPAIPIPRTYPVLPYAVTNPIWVDLQGNGFEAAGVPGWMQPPVEPAE
jgi:hypothetical protein